MHTAIFCLLKSLLPVMENVLHIVVIVELFKEKLKHLDVLFVSYFDIGGGNERTVSTVELVALCDKTRKISVHAVEQK